MSIAHTRLLTKLAILQSRLAHFLSAKPRLHAAAFARFDQLASLLSTIDREGESLLIGRTGRGGDLLSVHPTKSRPKLGNMLVVAPTQGGKSLLGISELLTWRHSAIVNDIKGELTRSTSGWRSTFSNIKIIDPTGNGNRFNSLAGLTTEDQLYSMATQLLFTPNEGEGAHFSLRAMEMLTAMFLAAGDLSIPHFSFVRDCTDRGLLPTIARVQAVNPVYATPFLDTDTEKAPSGKFDDKYILNCYGLLKAKLRPILTKTVLQTLSGSDFRAADLITSDKPTTVYLQWPEEDLLSLAPLVRLIMGSLINGMIKAAKKIGEEHCKPVLVLADEAGRTAIPSLAEHATTVVSKKISLWVSVQDLSQLEANYGKERAQTLINNMDTILFYRPNDDKTAFRIERWLGRKSGFASSHQERDGDSTSEGKSEQAIPLMTAQEIMQMADTRVIARHRNLPPILARRGDWREFKLLIDRRNMPPVVTRPLPETPPVPAFNAQDQLEPDGRAKGPYELADPFEIIKRRTRSGGTIWTASKETSKRPKRVD